ncbi:Thiol-disulfide isomerase or thioredoxin [Filimonas lacunae]|uniref:Thiol-disulfide isomerase or thioredoxin n=1 Tax=Filimonas lacunae TaxID=477680 RepID=A0A173MPL0_9BACT|nr:TlpA disulfide reductase family protein [Filimonas lacunae]BAV09426.1 similarity with cytochrome c-type biogenesis protein CcdA [Filimonas lacunae]SIS72940.1 Thiol-disulfide isomerase or thioredoxin [Filimonas lacunae]
MAQPTVSPKGKKSVLSTILSWTIPALALVIAFNTEAKAWAIRGLMEVGFFQLHMSADTAVAALPEATAAEDVVFRDGSGNSVSLSSLKGKVVFINFWATWCPPCRAEMPSINTLYNKFKDSSNMVFIMVDVDGKYEQSNRFVKQNNYNFPLYVPASAIPSSFLGNAIPTTVVLNKKGKIAMRHEGGADYGSAKSEKFIQSLLND